MKKKINKFLKQIKSNNTTLTSSTFKTVESKEFEIVISLNKEKKENNNNKSENNFVINNKIK